MSRSSIKGLISKDVGTSLQSRVPTLGPGKIKEDKYYILFNHFYLKGTPMFQVIYLNGGHGLLKFYSEGHAPTSNFILEAI